MTSPPHARTPSHPRTPAPWPVEEAPRLGCLGGERRALAGVGRQRQLGVAAGLVAREGAREADAGLRERHIVRLGGGGVDRLGLAQRGDGVVSAALRERELAELALDVGELQAVR